MKKYKVRKLCAAALAAVLALSLTSCGGKQEGLGDALSGVGNIAESTEEPGTTESIATPSDGVQPYKVAKEDLSPIDMGIGRNYAAGPDMYADDGVDLTSAEAVAEQKAFDAYLLDQFKEGVVSDSITLHYTIIHPETYDIKVPTATYGDAEMTEESMAKDKAEAEEDATKLREFDRSLLTKEQKLTYDILNTQVDYNIESYDFPYLYEPFAYTSGLQSNVPITLSEYKLYTKADVETYLDLLRQFPAYVDELLAYETEKSKRGLFMNSHSAGEVIRQCEEFIADPDNNLMIATFNSHIEQVEGLTPEEIASYKEANEKAVKESVIPCYKNIISYFKMHRNDGKNELGLAHLPKGKEYYAYLLKHMGNDHMTPEQVINRLDISIDQEMENLMDIVYGNYDAYSSYFDAMEAKTLYKDIDPATTIRDFEKFYADRMPELPEIDFKVENVHPSLEKIVSPAFFMTPALDDITHNAIYLNLGDDQDGLWFTLAHEGIAGHMFQFCYYLNTQPAPIRALLDFNAYTEGWATYIEHQSFAYYDQYEKPEYANLESINHQLNHLVSARVEIGVNYEGWDEEATREYLVSKGLNGDAAGDLIDYVIAEPANYQMYITGWLSFEDLRAHTKMMLGDLYDEKEFHKVILDAGPCPFSVLRDWVDSYIAEKLG